MIAAIRDRFFAALHAAGLPEIPGQFAVTPFHQEIPRTVFKRIEQFIRIFDQVTTRPAWLAQVTAAAPPIARQHRREVCFFSAWDFHLPPEHPEQWQLIECNDNGSGFLFAALINRLYCEHADLPADLVRPPPYPVFADRVAAMIDHEARLFFGRRPEGLLLVVDDAASLREGKFRRELVLLRELCSADGWAAEIATPAELGWSDRRLLWRGREVVFVINRSTDFFWQADVFESLRAAYAHGGVYVAPNPFTYATRSDKALAELLSQSRWDGELGILPEERSELSAHVPETHLLRPDNVDVIAHRKDDYVFKPAHGFASHGLLASSTVGRSRLHRLLKKGPPYVAQRRVPKSRLHAAGNVPVWSDLRVWAFRGECFLLSGRASRDADTLDLAPPGGWLPTYVRET